MRDRYNHRPCPRCAECGKIMTKLPTSETCLNTGCAKAGQLIPRSPDAPAGGYYWRRPVGARRGGEAEARARDDAYGRYLQEYKER